MLSRYTQSHWSTSFALHHGTQSNHKASEAQSERASKMAFVVGE
ncbi:hypothetical protein BRUCa_0167 [Brucella melitensis]|nr:conserved hypothetical protein [Brucella melitensis M28]ADZ86110.1 hypothetical protein BM590_A0166 [Brucella melitensis M5-90]AEW13929.1 hypothetical protein BCA52141_I1434 [Brucella canis HSK A52141]AEW16506.1 hypothetical protein BAA13334_I00213 [Brucella abortus A13334]AIB16892.1 Hypothetical protein BSSP3_I0156 [Brucella suis bv. 2]EEX83761.1 predicted protein [Brucella abortus bv. 3 str. Tulya]